ncbi:electron transfer flavoprotein subunit alpha/FixB family protein [Planosporangium flavigriseum]|uniref:Electron transfer flavoprotein subunit alpha n=1 Tax=Planosporangium flavigriseum TaxID=373681 RepID=A0A8J3LZX8_9ACTN|nr:electron transfer flavoprotein subunit alpha/FixB family protein [Planosporangium flavigriseum]NJC67459.1 electron transfer flavoprotein subunit alpha/FixB family protein [Planosporangium flavigriseum]GIG76824.1 electron transfer flavoprotein subunit alpha [Planosporangium flavigriseum]
MSGVLVVTEVVDGRLDESVRELVTAAVAVGGPVTLGVAAADVDAVLADTAIAGVDEVVTVRLAAGGFDHELQRHAVRAMIEQVTPDVVVLGYTIRAAAYAAALAEELGLGFASDVVGLSRDAGELVAIKPVYGGKVYAELGFASDAAVLVTLRPGVWEQAEVAGAPAAVREVALGGSAVSRVRHVEYLAPAGGVDLKRADVIFSVGRGVGAKENIEKFAEIANKLGAGLGASRPLVDSGWLPAAHQVGQTGVSVKPKLYVAFGISGALQHLAGMSGSKKIIAINTDKDAPIFNVADVGAVADILEVADELKALI